MFFGAIRHWEAFFASVPEAFPFLAMAGQRTGRSRFGFKMALLAVLCCALHLNDLNGYRTLSLPGSSRETPAELEKMTVKVLKEKLREKGKKVSGRKAELIARLTQQGEYNQRMLPPLTTPANPEVHVFIPLEDYGRKIEELFQGQDFLFIRGGVGVGKSTLGGHLGRQYPKKFVTVPFKGGKEESWIRNIIKAIEYTTQTKLGERSPCNRLEDALQLALDKDLILVLDEAHTIFSSPDLLSVLFKSAPHPKLLLLSASGEASGAKIATTPAEIKQKVFWTPPVPDGFDDLRKQLKEADVRLDQSSVEFFWKLCGGHRSIFIAAMTWVREEQKGDSWDFRTVVSKVPDSIATRDWSAKGTFLRALAVSRGVKVNGKYGDLDMVPTEFIQLLCEGPAQLPGDLRRELTIYGFVIPEPEGAEGEFREVDWSDTTARYAVSNPILASYYRDKLESVRGLKVGVDPSAFQPANCLDLLLRAIPYLTYEYVVGRLVVATDSRSILSQEDLPFEDLYSAAIINALQRLGYAADSSKSPSVGKVDIFVNDKQKFRLERIMAKRGQKGNQSHDEHRGRFDNPNQAAYSEADHKGLFTIGVVDDVRLRVVNTRAEGVEIIGLVPNIAHTGYHILYRGLEAKLLPHKLTIGSFYPWFCARKHSLHRVVVRFELLSPPHSAYHSERCTSCAGRSGGVQCWVRPCGAWVDRWANSLHPEVIAQ